MTEKYCEHCGAKMVEYKHGLSKKLCRALAMVVTRSNSTEPQEIREMGLDYSHRCNFQKLRYWGLVEKIGDKDSKGGLWRVTERGMAFVMGKISCPRFAWTYRGDVVRHEGEPINITDISGGWKYRIDYARESEPHK